MPKEETLLGRRSPHRAYAPSVSRPHTTHSIKGSVPGSLDMFGEWSDKFMTFTRSPSPFGWNRGLCWLMAPSSPYAEVD